MFYDRNRTRLNKKIFILRRHGVDNCYLSYRATLAAQMPRKLLPPARGVIGKQRFMSRGQLLIGTIMIIFIHYKHGS